MTASRCWGSWRARPPSIALEVMTTQAWPSFASSSDAVAVSGVLRQLSNGLLFAFSAPRIMNPSLPNENHLRDLDPDHLETYRTKLNAAAGFAEAALRERDEGCSIGLWQRLMRARYPQQAD